MKKILIALTLFFAVNANSQVDKGVFFDANLGARFGGSISNEVTLGPGFHANGAVGYMFSNIIGIRGDFGFSTFKAVSIADAGNTDKSSLFNANLQAHFCLSQLIGFGTEKFDLFLHTGFGFSSFNNSQFKENVEAASGEFGDRYIKGNDEALNIPFGLTPSLHINEKISINLDVSHYVIFNQNHSIDRTIGNADIEGTTGLTTTMLGITYRL